MVYREMREGDNPNKGRFHGCCNRRGCMQEHHPESPIQYYNIGTGSYYCRRCAHSLNEVNQTTTMKLYGSHQVCFEYEPKQVVTSNWSMGQTLKDLCVVDS